MKYMLLIYGDEKERTQLSDAAMGERVAAYQAYTKALQAAGILVASERLADTHSASTVRVHNSKPQVLDGPYAETKEQLGGFYLIEVKDLDAALDWASRCPGASHGSIEVRPLWQMTS